MYRLPIAEKVARLSHLKEMGNKFFKMGNWGKAKKHYNMVAAVFRNKDARNNSAKEDETLTTYREGLDRLDEVRSPILLIIATKNLPYKSSCSRTQMEEPKTSYRVRR